MLSEHSRCGCGGEAIAHHAVDLGDFWFVYCPKCKTSTQGAITTEAEAWRIWDQALSRPLTSGNHLGEVRGWIQRHCDEPEHWGSREPLRFRWGGPSCYDLEQLAQDIRDATLRELHRRGLTTVESLGLLRGALPKENPPQWPPQDHMAYLWLVTTTRRVVEDSKSLNVEELIDGPSSTRAED